MIYSFSNFGYEGQLVQIESELKSGIPSIDIIGMADGVVKESRERIKNAIRNSSLECFALTNRCLISLNPADVKKDDSNELAMALEMLKYNSDYKDRFRIDLDILVLGRLELNGKVLPVKGTRRAVELFAESETESSLKYVICPTVSKMECENINEDLRFCFVDTLNDAVNALIKRLDNPSEKKSPFQKLPFKESDSKDVVFNDNIEFDVETLKGLSDSVENIAIAVAGKHHLLLTGKPGCGKTLAICNAVPYLTPKLTDEENQDVLRINSECGLFVKENKNIAPFRMPHTTASIEGMCGGGANLRPGEITVAHNGILFLDEAAEFKSSVLQMLRVPLESHKITLSRAGRCTTYPAHFQLMMASNTCPCGNYGSESGVCLCSEKSIEMYWRKFSAPLLDRVEIKLNVERKDDVTPDMQLLREQIKKAFEVQRRRGFYNKDMIPEQLEKYCKVSLTDEQKEDYEKLIQNLSQRQFVNALKVARTIADMNGRFEIYFRDLQKAVELGKMPVDVNIE